MSVLLSEMSDVPFVGSCFELLADITGVIVGGIISKDWSEALADVAKSLKEFALGLADDARTVIEKGIDALNYVCGEIADWFNRLTGKKRTDLSPRIRIDTFKLSEYAGRLSEVNKRIVKLDGRLDKLYWSVGLKDLWNLIQADALTGYSWRILRCSEYLQETSNLFYDVETDLTAI